MIEKRGKTGPPKVNRTSWRQSRGTIIEVAGSYRVDVGRKQKPYRGGDGAEEWGSTKSLEVEEKSRKERTQEAEVGDSTGRTLQVR